MISNIEVDEYFNVIEFNLDNKKFKAVVDKLVLIEGFDILDEGARGKLDNQLQEMASYQGYFIGALKALKTRLKTKETEYKVWYADTSEGAKASMLSKMNKMVEDNEITKGNVKIPSKAEIDNWIISNFYDEWKSLTDELNELEVLCDTIYEYLVLLRGRANDLRALVKKDNFTEFYSDPTIKNPIIGR